MMSDACVAVSFGTSVLAGFTVAAAALMCSGLIIGSRTRDYRDFWLVLPEPFAKLRSHGELLRIRG